MNCKKKLKIDTEKEECLLFHIKKDHKENNGNDREWEIGEILLFYDNEDERFKYILDLLISIKDDTMTVPQITHIAQCCRTEISKKFIEMYLSHLAKMNYDIKNFNTYIVRSNDKKNKGYLKFEIKYKTNKNIYKKYIISDINMHFIYDNEKIISYDNYIKIPQKS